MRLTATDVARLCEVDPKTIHNWVARGKIPFARTEGGHLRFRRADLISFLRRWGYAVPAALASEPPRVVAVVRGESAARTARALARRFEAVVFDHPLDGLLAAATLDADALVADDALFPQRTAFDLAACIERLRAIERTKHLRVVATAASEERRAALLRAGAADVLMPAPPARVRDALERLFGVGG